MTVVYTALFGDLTRDQLRPPPMGCTARHVCFTDARLSARGWDVERITPLGRSPLLLARICKARPDRWFGEDVPTIWVDASCELLMPASDVFSRVTAAVAGLKHPDRSTIIEEAAVVVRWGLASAAAVAAQIEAYVHGGFPVGENWLTTTGFLVRTPAAAPFNALWETQLLRHSLRDQLSIDYCAWATHTSLEHLPGSYRDNGFMRYHRHKRLES